MFPIMHNGLVKPSIFKMPVPYSKELELYYRKNKIIDNEQVLISATSGGGKSILLEKVAEEYHNEGKCVVISITEKEDDEFALGCVAFEPVLKFHLDILSKQGDRHRKYPVKFYHPFIFPTHDNNFHPEAKIFPINYYTFDVTQLSSEALQTILIGNEDKEIVRACLSIMGRLGKDDNLWDFLYKANKGIAELGLIEEIAQKPSKDNFYIPVKGIGDQRTLRNIVNCFGSFRDYFFLQPSSFKLNINWRRILNDPRSYHIFSTKWIKDNRLKVFVIIQLLKGLQNELSKMNVKYPCVIILEEIKILLPVNVSTIYEAELANLLRKLLSSIRTKGRGVTTLATTQTYRATNKEYRDSCTLHIIGRSAAGDKRVFLKDYGFSASAIEEIESLRVGRFFWRSQGKIFKFDSFMPLHRHFEAGENTFEEWNKFYPNDTSDCLALVEEMSNMREVDEREAAERSEKDRERFQEQLKKKEERKDAKVQVKELGEGFGNLRNLKKIKKKEELMARAYEMRKSGKSLSEMALELKVEYATAKKYAMLWANKLGDEQFLKDNA